MTEQINEAYEIFRQTYRDDPAKFVRECIIFPRDAPTPYQLNAMEKLVADKRVCVRSLHGAGKTAFASWVVHWFSLTRDGDPLDDWKCVTTASVWRQLTKYLWPEIHKWSRFIRWEKIGRKPYVKDDELLLTALKLSTGSAFAVASDDGDAIEGAHARCMLYVFDEAKAIRDGIFDSAEGAFASGETSEALALVISTPGEPIGRFYDIQARKKGYEDWTPIHWSLQDVLAAKRVTLKWAEQRKRQWGEKSAIYLNRVEGKFASSAMNSVIPLAWVEVANQNWLEWQEENFPGAFTGLGVDVGGGGENGDKSIIAWCYDFIKIKSLEEFSVSDPLSATMELAGRVAGLLSGNAEAIIDANGIGAGTAARLYEQGRRVRAWVGSKATHLLDQSEEFGFRNWRSAGWWILRELLDPALNIKVCLPPDDELTGELVTPTYKYLSGGVIAVEEKKEVVKRLQRSTDKADAVINIIAGVFLCDAEEAEKSGIYEEVRLPVSRLGNY